MRPAAGFERARRLTQASEFNQVFKSAWRSSDPFFLVIARASGLGPARLGLAVSRRNLRQAVERNRVKRLVRESFRQRPSDLEGLDLVVVARSPCAGAENRTLTASLERHWQRLIQRRPPSSDC